MINFIKTLKPMACTRLLTTTNFWSLKTCFTSFLIVLIWQLVLIEIISSAPTDQNRLKDLINHRRERRQSWRRKNRPLVSTQAPGTDDTDNTNSDNQANNKPMNRGHRPGTTKKPKNGEEQRAVNLIDFYNQMIDRHNDLRDKHCTRSLSWDSKIAQYAKNYTYRMTDTNVFQHNQENKYGGESVWWGNFEPTGKEVTDDWYSEIMVYNWKNPHFSEAWGHFSQMMWNDSYSIGIHSEKGDDGWYVYAVYWPPGNIEGEYQQNVFKEGDCRKEGWNPRSGSGSNKHHAPQPKGSASQEENNPEEGGQNEDGDHSDPEPEPQNEEAPEDSGGGGDYQADNNKEGDSGGSRSGESNDEGGNRGNGEDNIENLDSSSDGGPRQDDDSGVPADN